MIILVVITVAASTVINIIVAVNPAGILIATAVGTPYFIIIIVVRFARRYRN